MLAIARGLMMDPDIIMLDEPSLGLAPIIVEEIFDLILKNRENGEITLTGSGKELLNNEKVQAAYLGS